MTLKIGSFESERLLMEVRREHHADELYEYFLEKDLYHYIRWDVPESREWLAAGFKESETQIAPNGKDLWLGWVGREKATGKPIGVFGLSTEKDEANLSYVIFKDSWGKGYAGEGARAMMEFCRPILSSRCFNIEMDTRNRASVKVAEKLGFDFVRVKNNADFLKGLVSHEFVFQKLI